MLFNDSKYFSGLKYLLIKKIPYWTDSNIDHKSYIS